jgi:hypothetical protein
MAKAQLIKVPVVITIHELPDNTVVYQRRDIFTIEKTDAIVTALHAVAIRSGQPVAKVLEQFSRQAVEDKLAKDAGLQKIINDFKKEKKVELRLAVILDGAIVW